MDIATLIQEDIDNHTLEELKQMRDIVSCQGYHSLSLDLTHMIADKTMEEIKKGNIKTYPFTCSTDLLG